MSINVKDKTNELALAMEERLKFHGDTSVFKEDEESSLYNDNLPPELTPQLCEIKDDYDTLFNAAGNLAFGRLSVAQMAKDPQLEKTYAELNMSSKNSLRMTMDRHKSYPNPQDPGTKIDKYAVITTNYEVVAGKDAGELKKAKRLIMELGMEQLK